MQSLMVFLSFFLSSALTVGGLSVESQEHAIVDCAQPRFSWKMFSDEQNALQTAYQIQAFIDDQTVWDSGKVESSESVLVPWTGPALQSSRVYTWQVRVWDQNGNVSDWSDEYARFVTGILHPEEWKAKWIAMPEKYRPDLNLDGASWIGAPVDGNEVEFEKKFTLEETENAGSRSVQLALAADQKFEIWLNGEKAYYSIGMVFNPDQMRFFDLTNRVKPGENVLHVKVSNPKAKPALLARLDVFPVLTAAETGLKSLGEPVQTVLSDASWLAFGKGSAEGKPAVALGSADSMPWGKVRRRTETKSPAFEKKFTIEHPENVQEAILHCTAAGYFLGILNDARLDDESSLSPLSPNPTNYDSRVLYRSFPIEDLEKENTLRFYVGHGWYDMRTVATWNYDAAPWRDFPRMIAQLEIRFKDGSTQWVVSDETWDAVSSPFLWDCIRQGVIMDPSVPRETLGKAVVVPGPKGKLVAERCPASFPLNFYQPEKVQEIQPGVPVFKFPKNLAGFVVVTSAKNVQPTDWLRVRYSEKIHGDWTLDRANINPFFHSGSPTWITGEPGDFQTDWFRGITWTCMPIFTYHGFQYAEVTVLRDGKPVPDAELAIIANGVQNDYPRIGSFECDVPTLNNLFDATVQAYISNFVNGVPTDCPHREKNGWTGDAQLAAELAQYVFENTPCYRKWLDDLRDEQRENGDVACIIPTGGWGYAWGNGPAWDSALVMIPWYVYQYRGDRRMLEENFDAMARYVDFTTTKRQADGLLKHGLSDWCTPGSSTPPIVTSTAYWYADAVVVSKAAEVLGKTEEARRYAELAESIRRDFLKALVHADGTVWEGTQCAQACALFQGLTSDDAVFAKLVDAIAAKDSHLDFGILGSKYVFRTLSDRGRTDLALKMILNPTGPSYVRMANSEQGTLWEDFYAKSSLNHIMFGDVTGWMFRYLAGIECVEPGFKRIRIAPCARPEDLRGVGLHTVSASVDSPYGIISSTWKWDEKYEKFELKVTIPANTTAEIVLPNGEKREVGSGTFSF